MSIDPSGSRMITGGYDYQVGVCPFYKQCDQPLSFCQMA